MLVKCYGYRELRESLFQDTKRKETKSEGCNYLLKFKFGENDIVNSFAGSHAIN